MINNKIKLIERKKELGDGVYTPYIPKQRFLKRNGIEIINANHPKYYKILNKEKKDFERKEKLKNKIEKN